MLYSLRRVFLSNLIRGCTKNEWNEREKEETFFFMSEKLNKSWNFVKTNQVESNTRCANINQFENCENR